MTVKIIDGKLNKCIALTTVNGQNETFNKFSKSNLT